MTAFSNVVVQRLLAESASQHHASGAADGHSATRAQVIGGGLKAI